MSKEIAKKAAQEVAAYTGPTGLADNITSADLHLPRVALLQSMSKQVQDDPKTYTPGGFVNTLTQDVIPTPLVFTPVFVFKNVIKWNPREKGGGVLYKTLKYTADVIKDISWQGMEKPAATQYINCVSLVEGSDMPLVISFCNTSFKAGQDLLTLVQLSGCAWKYQYELQSVKTSNAKGTWHVMRVKRLSLTDEVKSAAAAHMYENVKGMAIDTDYEGATEATSTEATGAEPQEF
jgi:hypothetical protein